MKLLEQAEQRWGAWSIPRLTLLLVASQSLCYVLNAIRPGFEALLRLEPAAVTHGEFWRLITFMLVPPHADFIFAFFALYIFYLMGTALEEEWGIFRYNVYILIAYAATVLAVYLGSIRIANNLFIETSVFLAFAYLYPEIEFLLFFIIPVKVKYLAMLTWAYYGYIVIVGPESQRILAFASVANFLIFFGRDIGNRYHSHRRRETFVDQQQVLQDYSLHRCAICSITEHSRPDAHFRVCSKCSQGEEYCDEHIRAHNHV